MTRRVRRVLVVLLGAILSIALVAPRAPSQIVIRNSADPDNAPRITTTSIPNATEGVACSVALAVESGRAPLTWSQVSGSVPTGTSLTPSTGQIGGTCSEAGTFTFTIRVVDALGGASERTLTWTVDASSACDQTFSSSTGLVAAVTNAANGTTICLNNGTYGNLTFSGLTARTGYVTVRSTSGVGATLGDVTFSNSKYVTFQSLTIDEFSFDKCSNHVRILDSTFTGAPIGLNYLNDDCGASRPYDILIDGNEIPVDQGAQVSEGAIDLRDGPNCQNAPGCNMGITISNNHIGGNGGCSADGIQLTGDFGGVTIGPGNVFDDIVDHTSTGVHCDSIQFFGDSYAGTPVIITGNWFKAVSVALQHQTTNNPATQFTNNLITNTDQIQVGVDSADFDFSHNTICNLGGSFSGFPGLGGGGVFRFNTGGTSTGIDYRSNLLVGSNAAPPGGITGTNANNLCQNDDDCSGSGDVIATPVFVGGTPGASCSITTWAGWQLASGSPGEDAGHDGDDIGTTYYGPDE